MVRSVDDSLCHRDHRQLVRDSSMIKERVSMASQEKQDGAHRPADDIVARIVRQTGIPDLLAVLADRLSPTDLQSLLLAVYQRRASRLDPRQVMGQYERSRFVQPAQVDPRQLLAFDRLAFECLPPTFEIIELSPLSPLGSNSALAPVSQNWMVSTIRNNEVCADATSVLALECARRRRALYRQVKRPVGATRLGASHRVLRAQRFAGPATFAHFRILSLCTAGRDRGSYRFEIDALTEQLEFYITLLNRARDGGFALGAVRVALTAFEGALYEPLQAGLLRPLAAAHPEVALGFDQKRTSGRGYYERTGFQIFARDGAGAEHFLVDGGFTDWTQQLLSNRKERLLTSGLGSERLVYVFGPE
jgi:hypothetical protein